MKPHIPVLVKEVLEGLNVQKGKRYIDATYGGGGHTKKIVDRGGIVLGIDADPDTSAVHGNFRDIEAIAKEHGFEKVSGILFDLGVSSHQLDTPSRGFSYRFNESPLDLRFDQGIGESAKDLINRLSEVELYEIFSRFGEEQLARPIARAACSARKIAPIQTVGDLVRVVHGVVRSERDQNPTLSRIFQALRIAVNDELSALREGLEGSEELVEKGGRLVVISFHSLEDRIVKQFMRKSGWKVITKRPVIATRSEFLENRRSRSAKLRIAEKL